MDNYTLLEKGVTTPGPIAIEIADVEQTHNLSSRSLLYHLKTLFLFTKSDFKTVILTTAHFGEGEFPDVWTIASRMPLMLMWIWVNLLVEDIANQRLGGSVVEDAINKPWRPLPSGRISPEQARDWLLVAILAAMGLSILSGGYTASITLMAFVWMYNDLDGSNSGIWIRNALNAGGLMCFSWGALASLSGGELLPEGFAWIMATGAIIMTTVHAQDLPDIEGDMARGRQTVPLLYGEAAARISLAVMVSFWGCNVSAGVEEYGPVVGRGGVEAVVPLGGGAVSSASI
ncbi:ubiA prenyltransferase family domain-containing protein [Trichoderma breve]|uniref:UbiA prenyltransferase family domain-containing protein n=1 Tax=Trichoderma breve TaxID=2034170 RepID=A0A9W9E2Y8_9HYPO|nr:ubiA prenyltransferase family domain-containing protein [Trichoderma breve]KAJ4856998.1 ubiA prenyltransferase family domain-containing protein [Trichoderma breve]